MSSASSEPERPSKPTHVPARPARRPTDSMLGRELLDSVLKQTALGSTSQDAASTADMQALRAVAARRRNEPFGLEPVALELVQAVLQGQFRPLVSSAQAWETMTQGITQTLFEDPVSRDRLQAMWSRLLETGG